MVTTINNGIIRFLFYSLILGLLFFLRFAMGSADGDFTMVLDIASFIIQSKSPALWTLCMGFLSIITFLASIIVFSRKTSSF